MLPSGELYHGWFSCKAKDMGGSSIYRTPAGQEVEVTAVAKDLAWADEYHWDDKQYVGPVSEWVRKNGWGMMGPPYSPPPYVPLSKQGCWCDTPRKGILTRYGRKLLEQGKASYAGDTDPPTCR